jgi:hypothetical protein
LPARRAQAADTDAVVEIDDSLGDAIDARAARRLIRLELADVDLRPPNGARRPAALFFRVLRSGPDLRVELWDRGEFHGARIISSTKAEGPLVARRVALAAAELARRLQKKRLSAAERERANDLRRSAERQREQALTVEGPFAVRTSIEGASIASFAGAMVGPSAHAEFSIHRATRLDLGAAWLLGAANDHSKLEWFELSLGPSQRFKLSGGLDLDVGAEAAFAVTHFGHVRAVDDISSERETWTARTAALVRLEPRLTRRLRLSIGGSFGLVLRRMPYLPVRADRELLGGVWLGLGVGVVLTPP